MLEDLKAAGVELFESIPILSMGDYVVVGKIMQPSGVYQIIYAKREAVNDFIIKFTSGWKAV